MEKHKRVPDARLHVVKGPESAVNRTDDSLIVERRNEDIFRSLRRIFRAMNLYSRELSAKCNLTGPQLLCLRRLQQSGESSPTELAKSASVSQATITGILDRLEERGLVARTRGSVDRRRVTVALTENGQAALDNLPPIFQSYFTERLASMPPDLRVEITRILKLVADIMEQPVKDKDIDILDAVAEMAHLD